ncbi:MAG: ribonuclease P protein component [Proteobacteria bacterium]|nr:ribonuclease P protein component [Pseudomonadota bacterium]
MADAHNLGRREFTIRLVPLTRPESFSASLRGRGVRGQELYLHHRAALDADGIQLGACTRECVLGFVVPKRLCKQAVRRNLIRRVMREALREVMHQDDLRWPSPTPVLVLKLTRKLPESFVSANSRNLMRYVRTQIQLLLRQYHERILREAFTDAVPASFPNPKIYAPHGQQ